MYLVFLSLYILQYIYCIVLICWSLLLARLFSEPCIRSWYVNHNVYTTFAFRRFYARGSDLYVCYIQCFVPVWFELDLFVIL